MKRCRTLTFLMLLVLPLAAGASPLAVAEGGEAAAPLDALAYTVVRTPPADRIPLAPLERDRNVLVGRLHPFPDRELPDLFWYDRAGVLPGVEATNERVYVNAAVYTLCFIDPRHRVGFRYFRSGLPFEYDLVRFLDTKKRELDIER
jgi:hypothetical protein